jgi:capsule polysaccharide export protein KpsE/RkpR
MGLNAATAAALLVGLLLVGCSEDKPPVCDSMDDLQSSVADVKDIDFTAAGALSELQTALSSIQTDLGQVKTDAKAEYSSQVDALDTAFTQLKTSLEAAKAEASADTLAGVGAAVSAFTAALKTLAGDVKSTC